MSLKSLIDKTLSKQPLVKPSRTKNAMHSQKQSSKSALSSGRVIMKIIIRFMAVTQQFERCQVIKNQAGRAKTQGMLSGCP